MGSGRERTHILEIALEHNDGIQFPEKLKGMMMRPMVHLPFARVRCSAQCYGGLMVFVKTWVGNAAFNDEFLPCGNQSKGRLWLRIVRLSSWYSFVFLRTK